MGYAEAGKTSLLTVLIKCAENGGVAVKCKGEEKDARTDGIDIKWWKPRKGRPLQLCAWDYAGQEEYLATHQFFLSSRSLHLLVFDLTNMQLPTPVAAVTCTWQQDHTSGPSDLVLTSIKSALRRRMEEM